MRTSTLKISSKGQIAIPKSIRDQLGVDFLLMYFDSKTHKITLSPVVNSASLGGSLKQYAKEYVSIEEAREIAKEKVKNDWLRS